MKKLFILGGSLITACFLLLFSVVKIDAFTNSTNSWEVSTNNHYDKNIVSQKNKIEKDVTTNLLMDKDNNNLEIIKQGDKEFKLEKIDLTRYRQKLEIEYYLGDYTSNTLIGKDSGYTDYDDSISSYIKSIVKVNEDFNQNIPSTYKFVNHPDSQVHAQSYIPTYTSDEPIKVKVLIAEVKKYKVTAYKYQNRQGIVNPSPIGKTRNELSTSDNFWIVNSLFTSFQAIDGQKVSLKNVGQFSENYEKSGRKGVLQTYGLHNANDDALSAQEFITVDASTPASIYVSGSYEVDDYDQPQKNPGTSSSTTSGGSIGFIGRANEWKNELVKESLQLDTVADYDKLKAYPFNLDGDPFNNPEHTITYVPDNWFLNHKVVLDYYYKDITPQINYFKVIFNSNGGSKVDQIDKVASGSYIKMPTNPSKDNFIFVGWYKDEKLTNKWDFKKDKVYKDTTLYAKWNKDDGQKVIDNSLAKAGSVFVGISLLLIVTSSLIYTAKRKV
ncbi:MAG: InlB B-repeat-containing protein [Erysipelotrichales bacterium]